MAIKTVSFVDVDGMKIVINPAAVCSVYEQKGYSEDNEVWTVIAYMNHSHLINLPIKDVAERIFGAGKQF